MFTNDKNIKEKNFVLAVIKSDILDFIRGKFETQAQILAKRPHRGLLASYITIEKYFSCLDLFK